MSQVPQPDMPQNMLDEIFMRQAIKQAQQAACAGEVPVGAVIAHRNQIVAQGYNQKETLHDPTAHAEMIALTAAAEFLRSWRLKGCTMYVTLEPCLMCTGAIVLARLDRLVYGAADPKAGACESLYNILDDPRLNHRVIVTAGILAAEASQLLRDFFAELREDQSFHESADQNANGDGDPNCATRC